MADLGFQTPFQPATPQPSTNLAVTPPTGTVNTSPAAAPAQGTALGTAMASSPTSTSTPSGYTPLTQSQYDAAISAGYSPSEILANEQTRKAQLDVNKVPYPATSQPSRFGQAVSQTMSQLPGFLKQISGVSLLQPFAKVAASGIRAVQATPQVLTGNEAGAQQTMAQPLLGVQTLGGSTNLQNLGSAAQAASVIPGLGEVSSIVGGNTARAAIQGATAGTIGGAGGYLANAQTPTVKGALGSAAQGAVGGAAAGAVAPTLYEQSQRPTGEIVSDIGQGVKNVANAVTSVPSKINTMIAGPQVEDTLSNLDDQIQKGIDKGVKPTVVGKQTASQTQAFNDKAAGAVKTIADLKDQINLKDNNGEPVTTAPKTAAQAAQAIEQAKNIIYNQYSTLAKSAGDAGATFDPASTVAKLQKVAGDLTNTPDIRQYAQAAIPEIEELKGQAPSVIEGRIAQYNDALKNYYRTGAGGPQASVYASLAQELRGTLDSSIENSQGEGYQDLKNQYGELKTLEGEMNHRAIVNSRQNPINLAGGLTDIFSGAKIIQGLLTGNVGDVIMGTAGEAIKSYVKSVNSPDANIGRMFDAAYNAKDVATKAGIPSLHDYTAPDEKPTKTTSPIKGQTTHSTIIPAKLGQEPMSPLVKVNYYQNPNYPSYITPDLINHNIQALNSFENEGKTTDMSVSPIQKRVIPMSDIKLNPGEKNAEGAYSGKGLAPIIHPKKTP